MQTELPTTQKEALATGSVTYFTGQACRNGHIAPRNAKKGKCLQCLAEKQARYREARPDEDAAIASRYREKNAESVRERDRARYAADPEGRKRYVHDWKSRFPDLAAAYSRRRLSNVERATPPWLSPDQRREIRALYLKARQLTKDTGIPHEVDHIEPVQGRTSCGLHVPWNMRVITKDENRRKSNTLIAA